jgi:hypothetical protein
MTDITQLVDRYVAIWNTTDAKGRHDLVAGAFTDDGAYVDPMMQGAGHDGIDAMIAGVQERFPGFQLRRTGPVDAHNNLVRFNWELGPEGVDAPVKGLDASPASPASSTRPPASRHRRAQPPTFVGG